MVARYALLSAVSAAIATALFFGPPGVSPAHAAASQSTDTSDSVYNQRVGKGDTLIELLESAGATAQNAAASATALRKIFDARKLRVGQRIMMRFVPNQAGRAQLSVVAIELSKNRFVEVIRGGDGKYRARRASQLWSRDNNVAAKRQAGGLITLQARSGSTIGNIMHALKINERDIDRAVRALKTRFDPRQLRVGQRVSVLPGEARTGGKLTLLGVAVHLENGAVVEVTRAANGGYAARRLSALTLGHGTSLRASGAGEPALEPVAGARHKLRVAKGATLMNMLIAEGVSPADADKAIGVLREYFDPRRLRAGQFIYVIVSKNDAGKSELQGLSIAINKKRYATVMRAPSGRFAGSLARAPVESLAEIAPAAKTPAAFSETEAPAPVDPQPQPIAVAAETESDINAVTILVDRGDTLSAILRAEGIDRHEADRAIRALRNLFNPRRLREGQQIILATRADKSGAAALEGFSIKIGKDRHIEVLRSDAKNFAAAKVSEPNLASRAAVARASQPDSGAKRRDGVQLTPRPGQGQAMTGAMIAAAAPAEQELAADPARVWPHENGTADASDAFSFPALQEQQAVSDGLTRKAVMIGKGDTLFVALTKAGSAVNDAEAAIAAFRKVHNPRSLQIGQTLTLAFEPIADEEKTRAFRLAEIALDVAPDRDILVARQEDDSFHASEVARDLVRRLEKAEGVIQTSLYDAAMEAGLPISVLMEMVQIFSFDVDFQREIQKGDKFEVLYENQLNDDGETVALGPVLFASLSMSGQVIGLYRHEPGNGPVDYFNVKGQSARKALMRTPINGASLSSGYGMRRHPILGYNKMHRGLDFSAPRGTPIVAAGDGVIEVAGRNGSYGKYIRIRHNGTYKTAYAHMKGYARGMRAGKRVRQGQTIGYVGTTGRSTGPHLHYEVLRNGAQMNPRKLKLPTGQKLKGGALALFEQQVRKIRVLIAEVPSAQKIASR